MLFFMISWSDADCAVDEESWIASSGSVNGRKGAAGSCRPEVGGADIRAISCADVSASRRVQGNRAKIEVRLR